MGGMGEETLMRTARNTTQHYLEQIEQEKNLYLESIEENAFTAYVTREHLERLALTQCIQKQSP